MIKLVEIILMLVAVLLGVVIFLLCLRIGIQIEAQNGKFTLRIRVGPFRKTIERKEGGRKSGTKKAPDRPEREAQAAPEEEDSPWAALDWGDLIYQILEFFDAVKDRLRIDILRVQLVLATDDVAKTGLYLGGASALSGMIYPFFAQNFNIKELYIHIDGDFESTDTRYDLCFACSFRPIRMIGVGIRHGSRLYRMVK